MSKWRGALALACAMALGSAAHGAIGIFDGNKDLGDPGTDPVNAGTASFDGAKYTVTGGGSDWWDPGERGHFVYKAITGSFRLQANVNLLPVDPAATNWDNVDYWAKFGVAFRNDLNVGGAEAKEVNAFTAALRPDRKSASLQVRPTADGGMNDTTVGYNNPVQKVAIQRTKMPFGYWVQGFADAGAGWKEIGSRLMPNMGENAYAGLAVTSHDNTPGDTVASAVTVEFTNVTTAAPLVPPALPNVPKAARVATSVNSLSQPGAKIHTIKRQWPWGYDWANQLLTTGSLNYPGIEEGTRIDPVVNLHDTGGRGDFANDRSFPGIDPFQQQTADPAAGDDDNDFATEATAYIALTKGYHRIGANSDDGTIIWIGGVEIGRTPEWKGTDTWDFIFNVEEDGIYAFRALNLEGGGGAAFELSDFDGSNRVLLNEGNMKLGQAVPEPATMTLLALGGLGLLARRRKA